MKAVAFNGSPFMEKGNTALILNPFLEGLKEEGVDVELFYISKLKVNPCLGDRSCWTKTANGSEGEASVPKLFEEIKVMFQDLPSRIEQRISERPTRSRRLLNPMMLNEMIHYFERELGDPTGILVISSVFRDEMPWFYEIGMETYHAMRSGSPEKAEAALREFQKITEVMMHGPFLETSEISPKTLMIMRDVLERTVDRAQMRLRKAHRT